MFGGFVSTSFPSSDDFEPRELCKSQVDVRYFYNTSMLLVFMLMLV